MNGKNITAVKDSFFGVILRAIFWKRKKKRKEQNYSLEVFLLKAFEKKGSKSEKAYILGVIEGLGIFFQNKGLFWKKIMDSPDANEFFMVGKELKESDPFCRPYFWSEYIRGLKEVEYFCKKNAKNIRIK
jgi:hypothetical protein